MQELVICHDRMLLYFESGDNVLFEYNAHEKMLYVINKEKTDEHDGKVTTIDALVIDNHRFFVTGGEDGFVKVWNGSKRLI